MTERQRPLISAKLNVPAPRQNYIRRAHAHRRLDRLTAHKVTMLTGVAGSGKSTLLAAYLSEHPSLRVRWIGLDANDNDVRTLWSYVLEALKPDLGQQAEQLQQLLGTVLQGGDVDTVLVELVNSLQPDDDLLLVLDDAHFLTDATVAESLQFFLRYSSERVHIALLTRDDPALYLGELRMAGQLLEIGNDDLLVTDAEARAFISKTLGLQLDDSVIERMTALAEGWIGGLQLLGVALQYGGDRLESLPAMGRPVVEYLSGEILNSLHPETRRFLIVTSILSYFDGDVARAVTGNDGAEELLRRIVQRDLFVVAADESKELYRYHHLFQQFLQQQFMKLPPAERRDVHRRAGDYYRRAGDTQQSVHHYVEAEQYEDALAVIEGVRGGVQSWRLLRRVPPAALAGKPDFIFQRLFSHVAEQQYDECAVIFEHFRDGFDHPLANRLFELLAGVIGNRPLELERERWSVQDLQQLPLGGETKAVLYAFLAMILSLKDQEQEALTCLDELDRIVGHVANPYIQFYCMELKSQVKEHMGDLRECEAIYAHMFRLVEEHPFLAPVVVTAHIGIVGILLKSARVTDAQTYLHKVEHRITYSPSMEIAYLYSQLELHTITGDREAAIAAAEQLLQRDVLRSPLHCAPVLRYLLLLDIADDASLSRFRFEQITAPHWQDYLLHARLLARDGRTDDALAIVHERLGRMRKQQAKLPLVETLLVKVHLLAADGADEARQRELNVRNALREAVHYSYENRLLAPFLLADDPVPRMAGALRDDDSAELSPGETDFLDELIDYWHAAGIPTAPEETKTGLLSERETEVLHVLAEGATNRQIAERLHISVATVKTHIVNIYSKLHVSNRVEAVEKARHHGLVPTPTPRE